MTQSSTVFASRPISSVRGGSWPTRLKTFLFRFRGINTTNWIDRLAEVYQNFGILHLHEPMEYPFLHTNLLGYEDILEFVNRAGNALLNLGVKKGDRVVLVPGNRVELGLLNFACHKIEAVAVPVNYLYRGPEIRRILEDSGAEILVTDRQVFEQSLLRRELFPSLRECLVLEEDAPTGCVSLSRLMSAASPRLEAGAGTNPRDVVQIFYSSGTTGFPKGAQLNRLGYLYFLRFFLALGALTAGPHRDLLVTSLPLAHIMGMCLFIIRLATATPWYFLNRFDPELILRLIQEKRATSFIGVPAMYSMLMSRNPERFDLRSIRLWGSAADAMPPELLAKVLQLTPRRWLVFPFFVEVYGQVETGGPTCLRVCSARKKPKPRSVGRPLPWVKVKVVDEEGNPVPRGGIGELLVKSPMVTTGYLNRPDANQSAFEGEWFRTGDLVRKNWRGLEFSGRKSERIKCGGYSVFPQEVEEELLSHPRIMEAAVVGLPDPVKGQLPAAAVVPKPGTVLSENEVLEWAKENIAAFKRPRRVKIVPELPRGPTQKVIKNEVVKLLGDEEK